MNAEIEKFLKENCNKLTNGQCHTYSCLKRGGWIPGRPETYDWARCPASELHSMALQVDEFHKHGDTGL